MIDAPESAAADRRTWIPAFAGMTIAGFFLCLLIFSGPSPASQGRRAILYSLGEAMLAENLPWDEQKCNQAIWRMIRDLWPELRATSWFHLARAEEMAGWPWDVVLSLRHLYFGDLLFANSEDYPRSSISSWNDGRRASADFAINHVLMQWAEKGMAVHAAKTRGFSETRLKPYWEPRITLIIRPPY